MVHKRTGIESSWRKIQPMNAKEEKLLLWINEHLPMVLLLFCTLIGVIIRFALKDVVSEDYVLHLQPWYDEIREHGISRQIGDYNLLYQMMIWVMTKFKVPSLYAYKLCSGFFDIFMAMTAFAAVQRLTGRVEKAALAYCAVWLSPIVFLNSAAWAQCDAIYSAFCLSAVLALEYRKYNVSLILLGIAFAFKLHTVFILPLFLFVYCARREFSILRFALVPLSMMGISLPAVIYGRRCITEIFTIYANQTSSYQSLSLNYPSPWLFLCQARDIDQYNCMKLPAICVSVCILALIMFWWLQKGYKAEGKNLYIMAYLLTYTCVFFLPSMHERYGFLYEVLAIILAAVMPKTAPLSVGLICISMCTYGSFLFGNEVNLSALSWLNLVIYIVSLFLLDREMAAAAKTMVNNNQPTVRCQNHE